MDACCTLPLGTHWKDYRVYIMQPGQTSGFPLRNGNVLWQTDVCNILFVLLLLCGNPQHSWDNRHYLHDIISVVKGCESRWLRNSELWEQTKMIQHNGAPLARIQRLSPEMAFIIILSWSKGFISSKSWSGKWEVLWGWGKKTAWKWWDLNINYNIQDLIQ